MFDIHCHILSNLDDGPSNEAEALTMAQAAVQEGIRTIVATPHHKHPSYSNAGDRVLESTARLNHLLQENGIDLTVLPGQEIRLNGDLIKDYENRNILTLNGSRYFFVEFPSNEIPRYAIRLLYSIQQEKGLVPVIVHPERNKAVMKDPDRLYELVRNGCLTQVTAASVTGRFGKKIKRLSEDLIDANLAHFIASDAHDTVNRPFCMREAYDAIEDEFGTSARYYFQENAELLVKNQQVMIEPPEKVKQKRFLGLF
ncbi:tyrosine protein phosphatase [Alteribacter lacisalsi]|uniref:Tyrosine-protein phosphatase n=1 Tax=Alteribacter lacisalsi TaxID=2045244 RepID=A0A2W0HGJ4_9BACI|nr:CpsB/CapC family capsule biosynthesis tyrosine phosphatase [Alteribacter lacisalsi]PYZ96012.1 tyrosine protein phosphatase [Alteribacter lacisalsi]